MSALKQNMLFGLLVILSPLASLADESSWDMAFDIGLEARAFADDSMWSGQDSQLGQYAVDVQAEFRWRLGDEFLDHRAVETHLHCVFVDRAARRPQASASIGVEYAHQLLVLG